MVLKMDHVVHKHNNVLCRQEGIAHEVLQWYICRMEAWFAADADMISLRNWDEASYIFTRIYKI